MKRKIRNCDKVVDVFISFPFSLYGPQDWCGHEVMVVAHQQRKEEKKNVCNDFVSLLPFLCSRTFINVVLVCENVKKEVRERFSFSLSPGLSVAHHAMASE